MAAHDPKVDTKPSDAVGAQSEATGNSKNLQKEEAPASREITAPASRPDDAKKGLQSRVAAPGSKVVGQRAASIAVDSSHLHAISKLNFSMLNQGRGPGGGGKMGQGRAGENERNGNAGNLTAREQWTGGQVSAGQGGGSVGPVSGGHLIARSMI